MELSLSLVRDGGTVVAFGGAPSGSIIKLDPNHLHYSEMNFTGSLNCTTAEFCQAVEWIRELPVSSLITHHLPLDEIVEG
ncbi:MAG: hypothetical protein ACETWB_08285 [Anaerolineae bacterium]